LNIEREAMKGRQADRRLRLNQIVVEAKGLSASIRAMLASDIPFREAKVLEAKALMDRLAELKTQHARLLAEIEEAERELA
jgi:hypothetical protein